MNYLNEHFKESIEKNEQYRKAYEQIKQQVDTFYRDFHDDPALRSEWGHYYFCDDDGGRLIFDIHQPHVHQCEVCGKKFTNPIYDGVWIYYYRNEAVLTAWKAASVYQYTKDKKYLDIVKNIIGFYAENYTKFEIHNKERNVYSSYEEMTWGCGRILPQGLNESIICIRMIQALEIVKDELDQDYLDFIYEHLFKEMYLLLRPQVDMIHNIRCWNNSALGLIGFFFHKKEIIDFVFEGPYNIRKQIQEGVTSDYFWYEGSIHYNFFTLEGISALLLFSKIYDYDFGDCEKTIEQMFISAYHYAFSNQFLPNPNDGWPSINLKTYSYIYHTASKIFGEDSLVTMILKNIENNPLPRTPLPLSKPFYIDNEIAYERLLFHPDMDLSDYAVVVQKTQNFPKSSFAMLRNQAMNVFVKYGLNGPSHAHPDIINIEVIHQNDLISRDVSNAGYRARLCNEWHRRTLAHNTVVRNGEDVPSSRPGNTIFYSEDHLICEAKEVYPGVDEKRDIALLENGFVDLYSVYAKESAVFDYVFHLESNLTVDQTSLQLEDASLGFQDCGYQHVQETKRIVSDADVLVLNGHLNEKDWTITVDQKGKEVYLLKTLDNPVNQTRTTILIREKGTNVVFHLTMEVKEK